MRRTKFVFAVSVLLVACGGESASKSSAVITTTVATTVTTTVTTAAPAATAAPQSFDDRPYDVFVPSSYDSATAMPLVVLLHGYGAFGGLQEIYFKLQPQAEERGFLYVHPDATVNRVGVTGWKATDACCNDGDVDDVAYLSFIIDEVSAAYNVDSARIYLVGHSNGGFMSYRMACDRADRIAAIVSLAGATFADETMCTPTEPVSVLQIHGTADETIEYDGGTTVIGPYPSADQTVATWSAYNGCSSATESLGTVDLDMQLPGDETTKEASTACPLDGAVELWTMPDGSHIPALPSTFAADIVEWLFAHPNA